MVVETFFVLSLSEIDVFSLVSQLALSTLVIKTHTEGETDTDINTQTHTPWSWPAQR